MITKTIGRIVNGKYVGNESTEEDKARLADMLNSRKAPDANTEREFFMGRHSLEDSFLKRSGNQEQFDEVVKRARKAGYEPKHSDIYEPNLAKFIGDPKAFIPAAGGKTHIKDVCKQRNWSCRGAVETQSYIEDKDHLNEVIVPLNKFKKKKP
jgi:hypothetical protein